MTEETIKRLLFSENEDDVKISVELAREFWKDKNFVIQLRFLIFGRGIARYKENHKLSDKIIEIIYGPKLKS